MDFVIKEYSQCNLISINGRIDSFSAPMIKKALDAFFENGVHNVIVDMKDVSYISSSGLLVFVNAQKRLKGHNWGGIAFAEVPDLVFTGFQLAGFDQIFDFYDDCNQAIGRF